MAIPPLDDDIDAGRVQRLITQRRELEIFLKHLRKQSDGGWDLHAGQKIPAREMFNNGKRRVWLQCGRSYGKSHYARYVAARYAIENPGSACYIIAPERKQAHEIHWVQGPCNITNIIPRELLLEGDSALNKSELRVLLKNGSFIKLDGSDNETSLRGLKPDLVVADEFQGWRPESWVAMEPNFIAKNTLVLILATPPDRECYYTEEWRYHKNQVTQNNPKYFYQELPTEANPRYPKDELAELERKHYAKGEEAVWQREYMAKFVPGGVNAVFGTLWNREKFVRPHATLMRVLKKDAHKVRWYSIFDPGTESVFAVLHAVHNPFTAEIFLLEEIYEKNRNNTSSGQIWDRAMVNERALYSAEPRSWRRVYDEAAAWFAREIQFNYRETLNKTQKNLHTKESMISTVKEIMLNGKLHVSDRLKNFIFEIENYVTDDKGRLPDKDDHLLDCLFYLVSFCNYKFIEGVKEKDKNYPNRYTIEDGIKETQGSEDWTAGLNDHYFD